MGGRLFLWAKAVESQDAWGDGGRGGGGGVLRTLFAVRPLKGDGSCEGFKLLLCVDTRGRHHLSNEVGHSQAAAVVKAGCSAPCGNQAVPRHNRIITFHCYIKAQFRKEIIDIFPLIVVSFKYTRDTF